LRQNIKSVVRRPALITRQRRTTLSPYINSAYCKLLPVRFKSNSFDPSP